ncbi:hypothetical protein RSSM_05117 [Rhodopirellula sallentina SM41]|uniref:Uncharacterized protein n=1 Tax=Rhodopirellula sallentina SM41 TaxID=1263870 RepID=M5UBR9_9BACT|nr:hypothetical protein RSSM_05117 [Rhodopirellula sallentina SM41]
MSDRPSLPEDMSSFESYRKRNAGKDSIRKGKGVISQQRLYA